MAAIEPFSDEQARALINLEQRYGVWVEAERELSTMPYDLRRKEVGGRAYLYEIRDRSGNGTSLGPWSPEQQERFDAYHARKKDLKLRRDGSRPQMEEAGKIARALRVPMLSSEAGEILREADKRGLLGAMVLVVGTNAMPAYAIEAGGFIRAAPDETQDFDLTWSATDVAEGQPLWSMLKAVDPTYTVNFERSFQARNSKAYEVEVLCAPSRAATMSRQDNPRPFPLPEQEWLLKGRPVDRVVVCRDGSPARVVAPDPRWFALQKLWMGQQAKRNALKRPKDLKQGAALLDAVKQEMPQFPLDAAFEAEIPDELRPGYANWKNGEA
ncbi:MAG: GSU2403 family nucleotidyltransferase fold protein [Caulobacterales bacterium]